MSDAVYVSPEQLRIGLYIRLELDWTSHPFTFSSFRIKSQAQIDTLKLLGLEKIRVIPSRCTAPPLDLKSIDPTTTLAAEGGLQRSISAQIDEKKLRLAQVAAQQHVLQTCEKKYFEASRAVKSLQRHILSRPSMAREEASAVIDSMVDSMLTQKEVAIHLVSERHGGESSYQHALNVAVLAMMLGRQLTLSRKDMRLLGLGALLHDVGKLQATTPPNVDRHVEDGVDIGRSMEMTSDVLRIIQQHHEYVDGSGPQGQPGNKQSMLAKIVCIANTYDNLCNHADPHAALTPYEALVAMFSQQRERFEPMPLTLFIRSMGVYPPGSLVQLSNNAIGLVIAVNAAQPLKPCVVIYDPATPRHQALIVDLHSDPSLHIAKCLRAAHLPPQVAEYLKPHKRMSYFVDAPLPDINHLNVRMA